MRHDDATRRARPSRGKAKASCGRSRFRGADATRPRPTARKPPSGRHLAVRSALSVSRRIAHDSDPHASRVVCLASRVASRVVRRVCRRGTCGCARARTRDSAVWARIGASLAAGGGRVVCVLHRSMIAHMTTVHVGRMFDDLHDDYDRFFAYGPGAMCWSNEDGRRTLWFLAPRVENGSLVTPPETDTHTYGVHAREFGDEPAIVRGPRNFDVARIFTHTNGLDWCVPGDVVGWDGDLVRPTFNPSIWLNDRRGWHGFIRRGNLYDA